MRFDAALLKHIDRTSGAPDLPSQAAPETAFAREGFETEARPYGSSTRTLMA
jgi:hypothetical protein